MTEFFQWAALPYDGGATNGAVMVALMGSTFFSAILGFAFGRVSK